MRIPADWYSPFLLVVPVVNKRYMEASFYSFRPAKYIKHYVCDVALPALEDRHLLSANVRVTCKPEQSENRNPHLYIGFFGTAVLFKKLFL